MESENKGEIFIYQSDDGIVQLDVRLENETVWLTQDQLSLFLTLSMRHPLLFNQSSVSMR